jgi:D-alanyl-lipoteichoic acid acyltransferase DltB (MBOAT superfamily)
MENFNNPYHARSIPEFWRRWHISLSTWFRDTCNIPVGGSRGVRRWLLAIMITFAVSGLWHGANWTYVAWGC